MELIDKYDIESGTHQLGSARPSDHLASHESRLRPTAGHADTPVPDPLADWAAWRLMCTTTPVVDERSERRAEGLAVL